MGKGREGPRSEILRKRRALAPSELDRLSVAVCERAIRCLVPAGLAGRKFALYSPLPGELKIEALESWLLTRGARLYFPRIADRKARTMELVELRGGQLAADSWEVGPYGIREPKAHLPAVRPEELDVLLVPGVAFSENGQRLGMGAGFYDRYLPGTRSDSLRVALCFDFQVLPELEQEPWDQPVHWVLTETRDLKAAPAQIQQALEKLTRS
jgi:5-formyltetrahydrofolate cyclo-ligase